MNAFTFEMFAALKQTVQSFLESEKDVRCIILTHNGPHFTAGLDLMSAAQLASGGGDSQKDIARQAIFTKQLLTRL